MLSAIQIIGTLVIICLFWVLMTLVLLAPLWVMWDPSSRREAVQRATNRLYHAIRRGPKQ